MPEQTTDLPLSLSASSVHGWRGPQICRGQQQRPATSPAPCDDEGHADRRRVCERPTELDLDTVACPGPPDVRRVRRESQAGEPVLVDAEAGARTCALPRATPARFTASAVGEGSGRSLSLASLDEHRGRLDGEPIGIAGAGIHHLLRSARPWPRR